MAWDDEEEALPFDESLEKKETSVVEISFREMISGEPSYEEKIGQLVSEHNQVITEFQTILTDLDLRLRNPRDKKNIWLIIIAITQSTILVVVEMLIGLIVNNQTSTLTKQAAQCPRLDFPAGCQNASENRLQMASKNCAVWHDLNQWCVLQESRDTHLLTMYIAIGAWALLMMTTVIIPWLSKNRCLSTLFPLGFLCRQDIQNRTGISFSSDTHADRAFRVLTKELSDLEKRHEDEKMTIYRKHARAGFGFFNATKELEIAPFQIRDLRQIVYDYLNCPPEMKDIEHLSEKKVKLPRLGRR